MKNTRLACLKHWLLPLGLLLSVTACVSVPRQVTLSQPLVPATAAISPPQTAHDLLPPRFSLVSWNIQKGNNPEWDEDLRRISIQSDLILLQEAQLNSDMENLLQSGRLHWSLAPAFKYKDAYSGVMTAGKTRPLNGTLQRTMEPIIRLPKMVLMNTYAIADHEYPLLVVNVHGVNFTTDSEHLQMQLENIAHVLKNHQGPIIVAGDFNTWSDARMAVVNSMADKFGLKTVEFSQQPSTHFGRVVDHIYYRGLKPLDAEVVITDSSDHLPLTATFALSREQEL